MKRPKIHREGRNSLIIIVLIIFLINVLVFIYSHSWVFGITLSISAILLCFVTYFFRNPERVIELDDPDFVVAPADGRVVVIEEVEEQEVLHEKCLQVSIFMSPFNVHANWYPIEGMVLRSEHQSGRHRGAWLPKSSTENERSLVLMETHDGKHILLRQIAGAMARRIVTYAKPDKPATRNTHLGFIKFGSRVDMYLPLDTEMFVELGDAVTGNETIIAKLNSKIEENE